MDEVKKIVVELDDVRKDLYNHKKVYFYTLLACLSLFVIFHPLGILTTLIAIYWFLRSMSIINTQTIKILLVDNGKLTITKETMNISHPIKVWTNDEETTVSSKDFPMLENNESFWLICVNNEPCFAYSDREFDMGETLKDYILKR